MTATMGISNVGLRDVSVSQGKQLWFNDDFTLADVLLPQTFLGTIISGEKAERQRANTGYSWPEEAQLPGVQNGAVGPLRRAPVPVLWRALVESGDRVATWNSSGGLKFSIGKMLAKAIFDVYQRTVSEIALARPGGTAPMQKMLPAIPIPNTLDETGQDVLLRECVTFGMPEPLLVWRPVALALAWLRRTENELRRRFPEQENTIIGHILTVYLGPDSVECTRLRLKYYKHKDGNIYLLPLRDRPQEGGHLSGMDWAANLMESYCEPTDFGAFWQLFTTFPEIWQAIAGEPFDHENLPRPWHTAHGWNYWNAHSEMREKVSSSVAQSSSMLQKIINPSYAFEQYNHHCTFKDKIQQEVATLSQPSKENGPLLGVIACGSLLGNDSEMPWLTHVLNPAREYCQCVASDARVQCIWFAPGNVAIAEGADIFALRTVQGIPTYLDTMPELSLFASGEDGHHWYSLLNAEEVPGGEVFSATISGKFALPQNKSALQVLLCKGKHDREIGGASNKPSDGVPECWARIMRCEINKCRDYNSAISTISNWQNGGNQNTIIATSSKIPEIALRYAKKYAEKIFNINSNDTQNINVENSPYRENAIQFPAAPSRDILLDISVNIKPASGLAKVSFTPCDTKFLGGRSIWMNYDTMKKSSGPQMGLIGWPELLEIPVHPDDPALRYNYNLINQFKNTPTENIVTYNNGIANIITDRCIKTTYRFVIGNGQFISGLKSINENGECCTKEGKKQLDIIIKKYEKDFDYFRNIKDTQNIGKVVSRATWLYAATPKNIVDYLRQKIICDSNNPGFKNNIMEYAGKCFKDDSDISLYFDAIINLCKNNNFNIFSVRGSSRILRYRANAPAILAKKNHNIIAQSAVDIMNHEANNNTNNKYKQKFFQCALLLLYLLRVRQCGNYFSDEKTMKPFYSAIDLIRKKESQKEALQEFESFVERKATFAVPVVINENAKD